MLTQKVKSHKEEITKSQIIRLYDVFFIGPFILYSSTKINDKKIKNILILIGLGTIIYNANNYLRNK